jgi:hypothetical protein
MGDIGFHALHQASPSVWVTPQETRGMCLLALPHGQLVNYAQRVLTVDEEMPDTPSNVYAQFPIARELHEIEGLTYGLDAMKLLGQPLYDTNSSIAERQCVYVVRDSSDMALTPKRVIYYSFRKKAKQTFTIDVTEEWMETHYGVKTTQHIKDCAHKETDGFMHVLQPAPLVSGEKTAMMQLRFITTNRRSSPRKQRHQSVEADDGYWEGLDANGETYRLDNEAVAFEVKAFYANRKNSVEESDGSFVVLQDKLPRPTIIIDDSPPVISVQITPEWTKQIKSQHQLDASERFLRYGQALGEVLNKTRRKTHDKMQGDGAAAAAFSAVADFGFDTIKYEDRVIPESWRVKQSDNTTVEVTRERVVGLFGEGYAVEVQQRGLNGHKSKTPFIDVPVGACRIPWLGYFPFLFREGAPLVRFPQGNHDTCVYSSFASALHFLVPPWQQIRSRMLPSPILAVTLRQCWAGWQNVSPKQS